MSGSEALAGLEAARLGAVAAWGLVAAGLVFAAVGRRLPQGGAAVLAALAALATKAALLPFV